MFVYNTFLVSGMKIIADALSHFQHHRFRRMAPKANPHPDIIPAWPQQTFIATSCNVDIMVVTQSTRCTYQSGLNAYLLFCSRFNIMPTPPSSLPLQYFCADKSQSVSYKTLKVYPAAICLMHIENGFTNLTTNKLLHLVCSGIRHQQNNSECTRLPITINLLRTLKDQLRSSQMSLLEQRLL